MDFKKLWATIKSLPKKIWQPWPWTGQTTQGGGSSKKNKFRSGWKLFVAILFGGIAVMFYKPPFGMAVAGLSFIYLAFCFYEIKSPDIAFLFKMGKFVGELGPGWYVTIPHLWQIEKIPANWLQVDMKGDMYTKEKTLICVHARVKFRVNKAKLDEVLLMMPEEMMARAKVIGLSALRGAVGSSSFQTLVEDKGELERSVVKGDKVKKIQGLKGEFAEHGYDFGDFKINDFDEGIQSEAERVKYLGKARGEAAAALAQPLKDNLPAALANIAGTLAESVLAIFGAGKKGKTAPEEKITSESIAEELSKKIEALVKRVV